MISAYCLFIPLCKNAITFTFAPYVSYHHCHAQEAYSHTLLQPWRVMEVGAFWGTVSCFQPQSLDYPSEGTFGPGSPFRRLGALWKESCLRHVPPHVGKRFREQRISVKTSVHPGAGLPAGLLCGNEPPGPPRSALLNHPRHQDATILFPNPLPF